MRGGSIKQNVKILGILLIVYSVLSLAYRFVGLGVFTLAGFHWLRYAHFSAIPEVNLLTWGFLSLFTWLITALLFILGIVAGVGLLQFQRWARILAVILSCIYLLKFPLGTALGIYGLIVLLSSAGARLFCKPQAQNARPGSVPEGLWKNM